LVVKVCDYFFYVVNDCVMYMTIMNDIDAI
jgi:hypothetical protein